MELTHNCVPGPACWVCEILDENRKLTELLRESIQWIDYYNNETDQRGRLAPVPRQGYQGGRAASYIYKCDVLEALGI